MSRRRATAATAMGIAVGTIAAWVIVSATASPEVSKLPDAGVAAPSEQVARQAVRSVLRSAQGRRLLDDERWRAVNHRWHRDAPCRTSCVATVFYRYDSDTLVESITTLEGNVVQVRTAKGQPPISPDEQVRAHSLAERDRRVRDLLDGETHTHGALAYSLYPDDGLCARHRCASVIFMLGDFARTGKGRQLHVLVDLSDERILRRDRQRCDGICEVGW